MACSRELRASFPFQPFVVGFPQSSSRVHLLLGSTFCPSVPLFGNKAPFSVSSCPRIVGSGVRIQCSCRCHIPTLPPPNTFSSVSVFLFFPLPASLLQGSRLLFAGSAFLPSSVLSGFLSAPQSSVSSFVMMRSLVGPYVPPPSPPFLTQLFGVCSLRLQKHRMTMTCGFGDG